MNHLFPFIKKSQYLYKLGFTNTICHDTWENYFFISLQIDLGLEANIFEELRKHPNTLDPDMLYVTNAQIWHSSMYNEIYDPSVKYKDQKHKIKEARNQMRPLIVCLCGSTKFKKEFEYYNKLFTLLGHIVLTVGYFGHLEDKPLKSKIKSRLDDLHKSKILKSDEIFVINKNGYLGESTKKEIEFAKKNDTRVRYMEKLQ